MVGNKICRRRNRRKWREKKSKSVKKIQPTFVLQTYLCQSLAMEFILCNFLLRSYIFSIYYFVFFLLVYVFCMRENRMSLVEIMKRKLRAMYVKRENNSIEYYVISPVRCFHAPKSLENQHNQFRGIVFARPPLAPFDLHIDQFYSPPAWRAHHSCCPILYNKMTEKKNDVHKNNVTSYIRI